jgi:peptidoglycan/xylan/chitin deacetylase (PgdA/CDA1 family)
MKKNSMLLVYLVTLISLEISCGAKTKKLTGYNNPNSFGGSGADMARVSTSSQMPLTLSQQTKLTQQYTFPDSRLIPPAPLVDPKSQVLNAPKISVNGIKTQQRVCAMTFDDGPHPTLTPQLLKILRDRGIRATFYLIGKSAETYPEIVRQIIAEGHEIGNHTWTHANLANCSDSKLRSELDKTEKVIYSITGYRPQTMRPPYGATNARIKQLIYTEYGYPSVLWSVDPQDWRKPGVSVVVQRLVYGVQPGAILLAHDIHSSTIAAMPYALDQILAKGYYFVTVTQLISMEQPQANVGLNLEKKEEPLKKTN